MIKMNIQRNTIQRQIILKALRKFYTHPTVGEVYLEIYKNHPNISKTTVYRNLRQLAKNGVISRVLLADGLDRFDNRTDQHYHFRCKICASIFDIDIHYLAGINDEVEQKYNFQIDEHDVIFRGICSKCRAISK